MIELINITKTYQTRSGPVVALNDINLYIPTGQIFGIIGRSGAGKSSLLRCLNLLERPTSGSVCIYGQKLTELDNTALRQARQRIGMIFQHFQLLSSRTVFQNVALPLELQNQPKQLIKDRVDELLTLVELSDKADVYPAQLSGGQKQRVAIARALANQPRVLLCDEATSALDPQTTYSILLLLRRISEQLGLTIVLITHEMDVVKQICDSVALIDQGKIIEQTSMLNFFIQPQTMQAKELVHQSLKQTTTAVVAQRLHDVQHPTERLPLLRLSFQGSAAAEPLISQLVRKFNVEINILQANIEAIREHTLGILLIEITHGHERLNDLISWLRDKEVIVEVVGYVS